MKLNELFPDEQEITLNGKAFKMHFDVRAMMELEKDYDDPAKISRIMLQALEGKAVKITDIVNFVHAAAKVPKDAVIAHIDANGIADLADKITISYLQSKPVQEQFEKLEVLAQQQTGKKKVKNATLPGNTLSAG